MIRGERPPAKVAEARDETAMRACREIRRRVFIDEQAVPADLEWDGRDEEALHFIAREADGSAVGTARMRSVDGVAKAERVAVLRSARGRDIGRALMASIEASARDEGLKEIRLNAQVAVIPFYEKLGYGGRGEIFLEAGIEHRAMTKQLD